MLGQADISDVELKQRWRLYWINSVFEFSSIDFQKLSWLQDSSYSYHSSFEECYSAYFDNLALYKGYVKAVKIGNVSQLEADKASSFHDLANFYDAPSQNPEDILQDEEWLEIVEAAKELWDYFKEKLNEPREIELMQKLEKSL